LEFKKQCRFIKQELYLDLLWWISNVGQRTIDGLKHVTCKKNKFHLLCQHFKA